MEPLNLGPSTPPSAKRPIPLLHTTTPRNVKKLSDLSCSPPQTDHSYHQHSTAALCEQLHARNWLGTDKKIELSAYSTESLRSLVDNLLNNTDSRCMVESALSLRISSELHMMCRTSAPSVLRSKGPDLVQKDILNLLLQELSTQCPSLVRLLTSVCVPVEKRITNEQNTVATICAMILNARNPQMCALQKQITAACLRFHAGNEVSENDFNLSS